MSRIIMYHYIRHYNKELPFFRYLNIKNFKNQISYFKKRYTFLKIGEDFKKIAKRNTLSLSFDDGLKDHFQVAKFLHPKKILGFFFISSYPYLNKDFISPHKIHLVLGKYHVDEVTAYLDKISNLLNISYKNKFNNTSKDIQYKSTKNKNEKKIILLKKKLNYSTKNNSKIINRIFNHFISKNNQQKIFKSFYLSTNEIKKMSSMGMCIGSHGHSHHLLSNLNFNEQKLEIQKSKNFLENLLKKKIHHFCFPFGGPESYNSNTLKILRNLNFRNSFTVENKPLPQKINYYEIPRLDCNIFRFGKLN